MPKIKNMYGVTDKPVHKSRNPHKHGNDPSTKSPSRSILVSQIFVCLAVLMVSANVWAVPTLTLSALDTNGEDSVFNGSTQKLRITIGLTGIAGDPDGPYIYTLTANGLSITGAAQHSITMNQTKIHDWDGGSFPEGVYIIRLEIIDIEDPLFFLNEPFSTDVSVTLDKTAPEISIGTQTAEFSPNGDRVLDRLEVFYGTNEGLKENKLEFLLRTGESKTLFGQSVNLNTGNGSHRYVWDGGDRASRVFPDGQYILKLRVVDKAGNTAEKESIPVTIDTKPPLISQVAANENLTLVDGVFINAPIQSIKVTADAAGGTPLDFTANKTRLQVKKQGGAAIKGDLSYDATALTFSFGNRLDTASENGNYTVSTAVADRAGNVVEKTLDFTFDNVAPSLREIATSRGEFTPGSGVSRSMNFVEATLNDNLQDGLDRFASTIRLTGPNGAVLGRQTQPGDDRIRWVLLSPLLPKDGLMDGEYTIEVNAKDKAGNETGTLQIPFTYDNLAPRITLGFDEASLFTLNQDTIYHAQPLSQIVATFDDAGVGVDLEEDIRIVFGTTGADRQINRLPGREFLATERNQLTYILETPLTSRDGSQDGRYAIKVQATDTLGNTETYEYQLIYDTQLPTLVSTVPAANTTVSELSQVEVVLAEETSGIDFIQSTFRLTQDQTEVPVNITSNGADTATLTLAEPIALDGSDDGTYAIEIAPIDLAGNLGVTVRREFYLVSQSRPEIRLTTPETTTVNNLTTVVVELSGYIGAGIDFDAATLTVTDPQGTLVQQAKVEHDAANSVLTWDTEAIIPGDGSADGEYTITATFVDFSGQRFTQEFSLVLDTQFPAIESIHIGSQELIADTLTTFDEGVSSITVNFDAAANDINFSNMVIALKNSDGSEIALNRSDNGQSVLTLSFAELDEPGDYSLEIIPQDLFGNQSTRAFIYPFRLDFEVSLPQVVSVLIDGNADALVYVNGSSTNIVATFLASTDAELDLSDGGSTITVTTEAGLPAPGITTSDGTNQLTWTPIVLPTDGRADGYYTVVVTPKDKEGRQGDVIYRQFIFDTQEPRITAATPIVLNQPATYIPGPFTRLQFTIEDVGPAGLEIEDQTVELLDFQGATIAATLTSDEINNHLYLTLDAPLAQDGSADGEYTVKVSLVDKAGNISDSEQTFIYDSQVPRLSSVMINTEAPVELVPQRITEISEFISSVTLQFEEATRVDFANTEVNLVGPNGQTIPLNISADGPTQLTARFVELIQAGLYTLSITPQDIAGNVAQGAVQYSFRLEFVLPSVDTVELGGQAGDVVLLNGSNSTIVATLIDTSGIGLALGEGGSSIVVTDPSGAVVPGQTRAEGQNQLIWEPISIPTDGSADGKYTVVITPVDKAGRQGDVVHRQFIYDTESPRITASSPVILSQPISYVGGGLNQLTFTVEDVGPADLLLEAQTVELIDAANSVVPTTLTFDELTNQLYLTLSAPFARDGSVDGPYTVRLSLVDRAGNTLNSEHVLMYDSQAPRLSTVTVNTEAPVELVPQGVTEILEPVSSITLQFDEATRVDFANTVITMVSSSISAAGETEIVNIPLTLEDDGISQMTVSFMELDQLDTYILSVTPQDIAENVATAPTDYTFVLDIPLPRVVSVIVGNTETIGSGDVAYVNANNMLIGAEILDPTETGLAFGDDGSDITVATLDGTIVPGATGSDGVSLLVWEPITLTTDGTTDGRYSVYVVPVDKVGRQGNTVYSEFIYDTQEPEIIAADPIDLSQPVSYISRSLTQLQFTVTDVGPADLVLSDQKVNLRDANGSLVPARFTHDTQNQLFLTLNQPLPLDGSMDGEYTVGIELADQAGNAYTVEHSIIYDTQAPTLISTVPANGALLSDDLTQIQVTLNDEGGSGMDWAMTTVTLVNPSGTEISGELVSNGTTALTLNTNQLVEDGRYIIRVQAVDRAGNGEATVFERNFLLSRRLPTIVSTEPVTAPADEAFTNEEVEQIEVELELETDDENHLSTLRLLNPGDQVVAGQQQRASGKLIYNLVRPLATDGSEDGRYTIEFTPISASGRSGEVQRLTFMYDTQAPEIESDDVIDLVVSQPGVNNSLTEIRVNLIDDTSGIDWENLDEEWLTFERLSPNATEILGRVDDDGQGNLIFRLTVPLADNGSADGEYQITVNPKDRAGNDDEPYEKVFVYDTRPPMIDIGTLLINDTPLLVDINAEDYPTAVSTTGGVVIQAKVFDTGLGVNLAQSKITVRRPDGAEISGNTQQNGVDTIIFKSDGLTLQGNYQVEVSSVGNDSELLGFAPTDSISTQFLYETDEPTATITSDGGETELTDEPLLLEGTASDPAGTQRVGEGEIPVPPSGVWLVEIVGIGPDDQPIDPVPVVDDSNAQEEPWSRWSIDFLPTRSGEYDLDVRVTDNAGNYAVYDIGEYTMSVSLTFRGSTFGWPNPLRLSKRDVAFFSFDVNVPFGETIELTLSIYDWGGDMVLSQTYPDVVSGQRNDQLVKWNLENQAGNSVARGLYIFRLEAVNAAGNRANAVGKILVVD